MEDFTELAVTLAASVGDARGSLILSRDGLVLGAGPEDAEGLVKPAWVRFASLGEPERGFVQFGTELWCYVRRGPYAAFVLAGTSVRPGLVIDQMDQVLLAAEGSRARRDDLRAPEPPPPVAAPTSKPRAPLHPESKPAERPALVIHAEGIEERTEVRAEGGSREAAEPVAAPPARASEDVEPIGRGRSGEVAEVAAATPAGGARTAWSAEQMATPRPSEGRTDLGREAHDVWATGRGEDDEEVDRFSLAREFSQLLQEEENGADG